MKYIPVKEDRWSYVFHCLECSAELVWKIKEPKDGLLCNDCSENLRDINDRYEKAPIHMSFDPKEMEEMKNRLGSSE